MSDEVLIFGKDTWPYTQAARDAFRQQQRQVRYIDVVKEKKQLDKMLTYSQGRRQVPVIVDQGDVSIGFNGGSWGV